jgi:6-hydroxycyclohex-1-ene-1-carbonyl-CoA dehydrogenase
MAQGLLLVAPGDVRLGEVPLAAPAPGEARIRVAGCGVCHTDIGFYSGAVRTRGALPLILGHEIAGIVEAAPGHPELAGRAVVVPAVSPCGRCALCRSEHETACTAQTMPGNDRHGGFATHVVVPIAGLLLLPESVSEQALPDLSVIADAITTPYQALRRANVQPGDLVVVVGVGGIGTYAVQIARAFGAQVAAIDVDPGKRRRAAELGASWVFDPQQSAGGAIRKALAAQSGICTAQWRIFEMSGAAAGQELAWSLLGPACTIGIVGFTMDKAAIRLSTLMAFDATAFGSWGCSPKHYEAVADLVRSGRVQVRPFVERHDLSHGPALLAALAAGAHFDRRPILVP